jgi:2-methylcitrate dehydratase PrpD
MDKTTDVLARYVTSLREVDLTLTATHMAKKLLIDAFGCAIGGFHSEPARIACKLAAQTSSVAPARVWGSGQLTSMEAATFEAVSALACWSARSRSS